MANRFCTTEKKVVVNHGGSVITKEPLPLGAEKYIALTDETGPNFIGEDITMGQFMRYGQRYDITGEETRIEYVNVKESKTGINRSCERWIPVFCERLMPCKARWSI